MQRQVSLYDNLTIGTIFSGLTHIINLSTILTLNVLVPECKCDDRGTQKSVKYGDWCWTKNDPCKLLTGKEGTWNWVRCHDKGDPTSQALIKCPRDNPG